MTESDRVVKENAQAFKDWMQGWVESGAIPGFTVGIFDENNEEIFSHCCSHEDKYRNDSLFRIYSMTKPITSVGILMLMERGLLSLEDEVAKFIPSFSQIQVIVGGSVEAIVTEPLSRPLKIIHLLTHTSGISYGIFGQSLPDKVLVANLGADILNFMAFTPLEELCERIAKSHLAFQPGTQFQYGFNTDVLGRIIEVVSGLDLEEFLQREILRPLGMSDTTFRVPEEKLHRLAEIYDPAQGLGLKLNRSPEVDRSSKRVFLSGGAGLVSSLADYAKFANLLLQKGKVVRDGAVVCQLLRPETVDLMIANHLPDDGDIFDLGFDKAFLESIHSRGFGFGLGVSVLRDPSKVKGSALASIGEYGWTGMAGTIFFNDPQRRISVVLLTQLIRGNEVYPIKQQLRWFSRHILK